MVEEVQEGQEKKSIGVEELPAVASNYHYFCKKCDVDRYHKVLAHPTASSAKLECEVCGKKVSFKLPKKKVSKKKTVKKKTVKKKTRRTSKASQESEIWINLKKDLGEASAHPYAMTDYFPVSSVIDHPKFGLGFVMVSHVKKIEVSFEKGIKVLVHQKG